MSALATVEWVYLLSWLPVLGVVAACVVAWRWGWQPLALGSAAWAALAFVLFGLALPDTSAGEGAGIAVFVYLLPCLLVGGLALLVRQRRDADPTAHEG